MRELQGTWLGALFDDNRVSFSGWTEMSYTASTSQVSNLPVAFNDRANTFLLQQQWFRLERPIVTTGTTDPSFGAHLDVLVGSDYRWTLIRGLFNSQLDNSTGAQNLYGVDPLQFYVNAYVPNLFRGTEFRVGRTYNPWGYESLEAVSTPLLSRSYAFFNTPFTLMGIGAYTTFSPEWSTIFILANGNDTYLVPYQEARMFGKITYAAANQRDNVQFGWTLGRGKFNTGAPFDPATVALAQEPAGHNNFNAFDIVYTHIFNSVFTYANETMYAWQTGVPANVPGGIVRSGPDLTAGTAHWASSVQYLRFNLTEHVSSILRVETFDDFNGQRTGFPGLYSVVTGGVQFRPRKGLIIRPELRYDYNGESRPFEGKHGQFLAASDLILRW
ncbi:MAG TPA: outer membrane beta-barrel protein [Gemmataceae bacterium]|nr:outer membrane beta-barrel protein [Gemmataceae bacterium]